MGRYAERWNHAAGCRRWFNVIRDNQSHELVGSYRAGEQPEDAR
jgi:sarcosine oxidase subunit alpha